MDQTDWKILEALQENARLSYAEIGRQVSLTAPAVAERVRKMENSGIIRGYHLTIDLEKLKRPIHAMIRMGMVERNLTGFQKLVRETPAILECIKVTGQDGYFLKIAVRSMSELQVLVDKLTQFAPTTTALVLETLIRHRITREDD